MEGLLFAVPVSQSQNHAVSFCWRRVSQHEASADTLDRKWLEMAACCFIKRVGGRLGAGTGWVWPRVAADRGGEGRVDLVRRPTCRRRHICRRSSTTTDWGPPVCRGRPTDTWVFSYWRSINASVHHTHAAAATASQRRKEIIAVRRSKDERTTSTWRPKHLLVFAHSLA